MTRNGKLFDDLTEGFEALRLQREDKLTYRVTWSAEDAQHVGQCAEFPSLSWLADTPEAALKGISRVVADVVADMQVHGEALPPALAENA
jgi:predicted RNase H-like HicB family nuclease